MHLLQCSIPRWGIVSGRLCCHFRVREETLEHKMRFPMAQTAAVSAPIRSLGHVFAAPFVGFANVLVKIAEASPRAKQIEKLNATTDAELAVLGRTREDEVRRIFGASFYI